MNKILIGLVVVVLLAVVGYYGWRMKGAASPEPQNTNTQTQQMATSTYATTTFSVVYPSDYTLNTSYIDDRVVPTKPIHGVSFTIPGTMATGTNLSSDTYISVEMLPRAKMCTGDLYLAANVKPTTVYDNGVEYSLATSTDAAAGNRYEEWVYALAGSSPCTAVRYFIHYGAIENYPTAGQPGAVTEFDHAALTAAFDTIRQSLILSSIAPTSATP